MQTRPIPTDLLKAIREQELWIKDHGGSRAGYIARYGSVNDPEHYGDGGEAIFEADYNELVRLREAEARR